LIIYLVLLKKGLKGNLFYNSSAIVFIICFAVLVTVEEEAIVEVTEETTEDAAFAIVSERVAAVAVAVDVVVEVVEVVNNCLVVVTAIFVVVEDLTAFLIEEATAAAPFLLKRIFGIHIRLPTTYNTVHRKNKRPKPSKILSVKSRRFKLLTTFLLEFKALSYFLYSSVVLESVEVESSN